ncbi:MAG: hypothetical protein P4L26_12365 [Terracidiphilus sp.]|nr:hypothetical protein [Terracidiphilus sp.]
MARFLVSALLLLLSAIPAFGKPHSDVYPIPCDGLWKAVGDTLGNAGNYSVLVADDAEMKASFVAVGAQRQRVNSVALNPKDNGCELQGQFPDSGYMADEEGAFKKRLGHSLAKLQAAKPVAPPQIRP